MRKELGKMQRKRGQLIKWLEEDKREQRPFRELMEIKKKAVEDDMWRFKTFEKDWKASRGIFATGYVRSLCQPCEHQTQRNKVVQWHSTALSASTVQHHSIRHAAPCTLPVAACHPAWRCRSQCNNRCCDDQRLASARDIFCASHCLLTAPVEMQDRPQQPEERERELCCSNWVTLLAEMRVQAEKAGALEEATADADGYDHRSLPLCNVLRAFERLLVK